MNILKLVRILHDDLKESEDKLNELTTIASIDYSQVSSKSNNQSSRVERLIMNKSDLRDNYLDCLNQYLIQVKNVENLISVLESEERMLIRARYIDAKTWEEVAKILGKTSRHVQRLHRSILKKLNLGGEA